MVWEKVGAVKIGRDSLRKRVGHYWAGAWGRVCPPTWNELRPTAAPPIIPCAPSPYAFLATMVKNGTVSEAAT